MEVQIKKRLAELQQAAKERETELIIIRTVIAEFEALIVSQVADTPHAEV